MALRWPAASPTFWPSPPPTRSPARSWRCRPRASSGGWRSGCRTCWVRRQATASAPTSLFPSPSRLLDEAVQAASAEHAEAVERWAPRQSVWPLLDVIDACSRPSLVPAAGPAPRDRGRGQGAAAGGGGPAGAAVRRVRAVAAGDAAGLGGRAGRAAATGRRSTRTCAGRPSCGAGCGSASARPSPAELLEDACERLRGRARPERPARADLGLRRQPAVACPAHASSPRSPSTATCTCGCTTPPPRCGRPCRTPREQCDAATTSAASGSTNPLLTSLSRDVLELQQLIASCAPGLADVLHDSAQPTTTRCSAGSSRTSPTTASPPSRRRSTDMTAPSRCTPATARPARSRCSARSSSDCSPTTRPSSRATSSSCARTSRRSRRSSPPRSRSAPRTTPRTRRRGCASASPTARCAQTNALLAVLAQLLELGTARITAQPGARPGRHAGGAAAVRVRRRRARAAARLDGRRRRPLGTRPRAPADLAARRRRAGHAGGPGSTGCCSGAAMEGALDSFGDVVPLDDVDSSDIDLAGRLAELVDRLAAAQALMPGQHTAESWMTGLEDAVLGARRHHPRHRLAAGAAARRARRHRRGRRGQHRAARPVRRTRAAGRHPRRPTDAGELPHRHPDRLHPGADALGPAPRRVPARPRRRRLPAAEHPRRRRRARPRPVGRRARPAQRGPPAAARRHLRRRGPPRHHLHRRRRTHRRARAARRPARRAARRARPHGAARPTASGCATSSPRTTRCSRSTRATSSPASCAPTGRSASTRSTTPAPSRLPVRAPTPRPFLAEPLPAAEPADVELADLHRLLDAPGARLPAAAAPGRRDAQRGRAGRRRCRSSWTASSCGRSASGCCDERLAGLDPPTCIALEQRRGALPPGPLGVGALQDVGRKVETLLLASTLERCSSTRVATTSTSPLADGTRLDRHRRRRARRRAAVASPTRRSAPGTGCRPGSTSSR